MLIVEDRWNHQPKHLHHPSTKLLIFVSKRFSGISLLDQLNTDSFLFNCT